MRGDNAIERSNSGRASSNPCGSETIASIESVHPWRKSSGPDTKTRGTDAEPRGLESVPPKLVMGGIGGSGDSISVAVGGGTDATAPAKTLHGPIRDGVEAAAGKVYEPPHGGQGADGADALSPESLQRATRTARAEHGRGIGGGGVRGTAGACAAAEVEDDVVVGDGEVG